MTDFRALCLRFVEAVDRLTSRGDGQAEGSRLILTIDVDSLEELAEDARAALAQEQSAPVAIDEDPRMPDHNDERMDEILRNIEEAGQVLAGEGGNDH